MTRHKNPDGLPEALCEFVNLERPHLAAVSRIWLAPPWPVRASENVFVRVLRFPRFVRGS